MTYKSYFQLDSIKWYKDGREFYRLHPHDGQVKIEMVLIIMIYEQQLMIINHVNNNLDDLMALEMVLTIIIEDQLSTILNNCTHTMTRYD